MLKTYMPLSKSPSPTPTTPKPSPRHPPDDARAGASATAKKPSRTERRAQIAKQLEEQINRQAEPNDKTVVPPAKQSILADPTDEWDTIRESKLVPRDIVAQDGHNRAKGWERGRQDELYFQNQYRIDYGSIPILNWKYRTPNNSKVSDQQKHWQSRDWIRGSSRRPKKISKQKAVENNPRLVEAMRRVAEELSQDEKFLISSPPVLGTLWKGVKVLGRGGQGVVGLWEYIGSGTHIWGRRIVIKQSLRYPLDGEREMMMQLDDGSDQTKDHVIKLLYPVTVDRNQTGQIYRMILEFCEGGDLNSWIIKQRKSHKHFSEENLWQFFECFARGLNLMDHGNESPERKEDSRNPMCHFDIKPQNILIGSADDAHQFNMPISKIADFGLASCIDPTHYANHGRRKGTEGFLAPEQFSARWAYRDAARCGHINVYGTHTNIWQIGVVMYMLATLRGPPRPKGFRCSAIGKKFTYGYKLHKRGYSKGLKSLIWRCLCDKPRDRPNLTTLNTEIASSLKAISKLPLASRSEMQLEFPEPQPPKEPSKGPPPKEGIDIPMEGVGAAAGAAVEGAPAGPAKTAATDKRARARPNDAATGTQAAPFIIPGSTKVLRNRTFSFSVVPKHLPKGKQEPIWFRACLDSKVSDLKRVIREDAALNLADDKQFLYLRLAGQPVLLMDNATRMLSLYGVAQGFRLELWTDKEAHDAAEPDEGEFDVL